jgi:hypothetical protein
VVVGQVAVRRRGLSEVFSVGWVAVLVCCMPSQLFFICGFRAVGVAKLKQVHHPWAYSQPTIRDVRIIQVHVHWSGVWGCLLSCDRFVLRGRVGVT